MLNKMLMRMKKISNLKNCSQLNIILGQGCVEIHSIFFFQHWNNINVKEIRNQMENSG